MNKSVERDFDGDENYKRLKAKQVYLFALNKVKSENAWDPETCDEIAYDLTMDAIAGLLTQEKNGIAIENKFAYLTSSVKNALLKPKLIFYKTVSKYKVDLENPPHHTDYGDFRNEARRIASLLLTPSTDAYKMYDFIVNNNGLSEREDRVAKLLNEGYSNKDIAEQLQTSESTVCRIVATIRTKLRNSNQ